MILLNYKMNRSNFASLQLRAGNIFIKWKPQTGIPFFARPVASLHFVKRETKDHILVASILHGFSTMEIKSSN